MCVLISFVLLSDQVKRTPLRLGEHPALPVCLGGLLALLHRAFWGLAMPLLGPGQRCEPACARSWASSSCRCLSSGTRMGLRAGGRRCAPGERSCSSVPEHPPETSEPPGAVGGV